MFVHSVARPQSQRARQIEITAEYTKPAWIGSTPGRMASAAASSTSGSTSAESPSVTAMCASPCTAMASVPGLATRRAIARASWSDALAPSTSPSASWVNDSIHIASACSDDSGSPSRSSIARR